MELENVKNIWVTPKNGLVPQLPLRGAERCPPSFNKHRYILYLYRESLVVSNEMPYYHSTVSRFLPFPQSARLLQGKEKSIRYPGWVTETTFTQSFWVAKTTLTQSASIAVYLHAAR